MILAMLGICFKIAAAPMHFYAADVYEGAAAPVTAFLGFVPKTAGMIAMILLLGTMGWGEYDGLPRAITTMLWMMAVLTMTLGNVGALLQKSVKRMLAYSSIAHSGYMLIGVIAGPGLGINAVLFYLLAYGIMNTAAFAVLAGLERRGQEIESMDDLAGLRQRHPMMAAVMAVSAGSLLGVPPLLGFSGSSTSSSPASRRGSSRWCDRRPEQRDQRVVLPAAHRTADPLQADRAERDHRSRSGDLAARGGRRGLAGAHHPAHRGAGHAESERGRHRFLPRPWSAFAQPSRDRHEKDPPEALRN